ncbi:MAG: hypothetical protein AABX11_04475 [Nanoarchaeota archaeon]
MISLILNRVKPESLPPSRREYLEHLKLRLCDISRVPLSSAEAYALDCFLTKEVYHQQSSSTLSILKIGDFSKKYTLGRLISFLRHGSLEGTGNSTTSLLELRARYFVPELKRVVFPKDLVQTIISRIEDYRESHHAVLTKRDTQRLARDYSDLSKRLEDFLTQANPENYDYQGISAIPKTEYQEHQIP